MRKWLVGAAAVGMVLAVSSPGSADVAQAQSRAEKTGDAVEVGSQYRRYRRAYRPRAYYPRAYSRGYYRPYVASPGYYSPYSYGYAPYGGYGYGYGYRPGFSIGVPGFGVWF